LFELRLSLFFVQVYGLLFLVFLLFIRLLASESLEDVLVKLDDSDQSDETQRLNKRVNFTLGDRSFMQDTSNGVVVVFPGSRAEQSVQRVEEVRDVKHNGESGNDVQVEEEGVLELIHHHTVHEDLS
jgi:hypothetical protein